MEGSPLIEIGLPVALFVIMIGIGLTLTVGDFQREARVPRGVIVGALAQIIAMPALGFGIVLLLGLPPAIAVGVIVCAACPGGTTSNLIAFLARANVALSIVLTVLASTVTILTLPLASNLAIGWLSPTGLDAEVVVPVGRTVVLLAGIVLVPVAIGMVIRSRTPERAAKLERLVSAFGAVVLIALIVGIAYSVRDEFWELLGQAGPATLLLSVAGMALGYGIAALARLDAKDRVTVGIELGIKNTTLGLLIAITIMGSETVAVPPAVYGLLMYLPAAAVVTYGRRRWDRPGVRTDVA